MRDPKSNERNYAEFHKRFAHDFRGDLAIYLDLALKQGGPVLEVGCRTGRVTARIAAEGLETLGVDTSRPMLEVAVEHVRPWAACARVADFDLRGQPTADRFSVALVTLFCFNELIDVEEQRLFLRHLRQSMAEPGVVAIDLYCPVSLSAPEQANIWRESQRVVSDRVLTLGDKREMLTPLLERRVLRFRVDNGPVGEKVMHRRYIPPQQASSLLEESGFEDVVWVQNYDLSTAGPVTPDDRPSGPFMMIARLS